MSTAAVTSIFGAGMDVQRRAKCVTACAESLKIAGIPLLVVNAAGDEWTCPDNCARLSVRLPEGAVFWQKEVLLNYGIDRLPADVDRVLWVDCDAQIGAGDFRQRLEETLDRHAIVQGCQFIRFLDSDGRDTGIQACAYASEDRRAAADRHHGSFYGFAWAARREAVHSFGGLYDRSILGAGDTIFCAAVLGDAPAAEWTRLISGEFHASVRRYCDAVSREKLTVGVVHATGYHTWHRADGQWGRDFRFATAKRYGFDPDRHVVRTADGLLAWSDGAPQGLQDDLREYIQSMSTKQ